MRNRDKKRFCLLLAIVVCLCLFSGCDRKLKGRISSLSTMEAQDGEVSRQRINELKKSIAEYQKNLDQALSAAVNLGDFHRSLGLEYMGLEMYQLALESFQAAMEIYPTSPALYYYAGLCAGQVYRGRINGAESEQYLSMAEQYYLRALGFNPGYADAAYALAVIYQLEMDRPQEAEGLLETVLALQPENINALFLFAGVKVKLGKIEEAVSYYEKIASVTKDAAARNLALQNRDELLAGRR